MSDFSLSGWTKIAASGASRNLEGAPVYTAVNDITRLAPEVITFVLAAVRNKVRITFAYRPIRQQRPCAAPWIPGEWSTIKAASISLALMWTAPPRASSAP